MVTKAAKKAIDQAIKDVWLHEICQDYGNGLLLKEANLQSSLYHHLRNRLSPLLEENGLVIYTEQYFKSLKYYADLAIVEMDMGMEGDRLSEKLTDVAAIIELKYDGGYSETTENFIRSDLPKMKKYAQSLNYDCQYYFGVIYETECTWLHWFDKRSTNNWARGRLTELNAGYLNGTMYFEINSYNGLNRQHDEEVCTFRW